MLEDFIVILYDIVKEWVKLPNESGVREIL